MTRSLFEAAFAHNTWATLQVIDACTDLHAEQLGTSVPGTRGPILDTLRHIVEDDAFDLEILTGVPAMSVEQMPLPELRDATARIGAAWGAFLADPIDPDEMVREVDPGDGYERDAPIAFRLAGTLNHGTDHRSQICTALTTLGIDPPKIDVMSYGIAVDRVFERWPEGEPKG
ncbi:MAG TPA: DinB family protein [Actinomycetota bacterium]|jgi:uncharacterized damage-inducible protein DinB|nr:DinB family protein [Actinomycetota bacterium]